MIRNLLLAAVFAPMLALALPQGAVAKEYKIDPDHTSASFKVKHMMVTWVRGDFESGVNGTVRFDPDDLASFHTDVTIDVATIDTRSKKRDTHLRSADFFGAKKNPQMTFVSREVQNITDDGFQLVGDMTIRGTTREVVLDVEGPIGPVKHPMGATVYGFQGTTVINRTDFGLTWNMALKDGGMVVGEEVHINIDLELKK